MIFHESDNWTILLVISNNCFKYAPKWMVSSLIFQKFSGEGLTEPPPQTPPPAFSRASPSVRASPSILGRFAPSTRASPSILGRFAPSIRASPSTFDWGPWFGPHKINSWIRPCIPSVRFVGGRVRCTPSGASRVSTLKFVLTPEKIVKSSQKCIADPRSSPSGFLTNRVSTYTGHSLLRGKTENIAYSIVPMRRQAS